MWHLWGVLLLQLCFIRWHQKQQKGNTTVRNKTCFSRVCNRGLLQEELDHRQTLKVKRQSERSQSLSKCNYCTSIMWFLHAPKHTHSCSYTLNLHSDTPTSFIYQNEITANFIKSPLQCRKIFSIFLRVTYWIRM